MADEPSQNGHPAAREYNLGIALGARVDYGDECFTIYIPNKDQHGDEIGNQRKWVLEALRLLSDLNGGATSMPPVEGVWRGDGGQLVWEHPVVVYSFIRNDAFFDNLSRIREFLHRMGRETDQGEVAFEFSDRFYLLRDYDPPTNPNGGPV